MKNAYLMAWAADQPLSILTVPAIGGTIGLACGLLVAALFNFAWGSCYRYLAEIEIREK